MMLKTDRKRYIITILMAICFAIGIFVPVSAADFPPKPTADIYVVDQAGVVKPEAKAQMMTLGRELNAKTKAQVVVVTVKTLDGMDIEQYANQLFRNWGIGDRKSNNGIMFLVAVNDRKMRLEIGGGLEGRIPDMAAGRIMDDFAKPYFVKGDYSQGILNVYKVVVAEAAAEYGVEGMSAGKADTLTNPPKKQSGEDQLLALFLALSLFGKITVIIVILIILYVCLKLGIFPFPGGGGSSGGGFSDRFGGGGSSGGGSNSNW